MAFQKRAMEGTSGANPYAEAASKPPLPKESKALAKAYSECIVILVDKAQEAFEVYGRDSHLGLGDVLSELWVIFVRQVLRWDPDKAALTTWCYVDTKGAVRDLLQKHSGEGHTREPLPADLTEEQERPFDWRKVVELLQPSVPEINKLIPPHHYGKDSINGVGK